MTGSNGLILCCLCCLLLKFISVFRVRIERGTAGAYRYREGTVPAGGSWCLVPGVRRKPLPAAFKPRKSPA